MMGFRVCETRCDQCLFSPDKIVSAERRAEILRTCAQRDTHFICHKWSIAAMDTGEDAEDPNGIGNVCCRGFYDMNPEGTNLMRIAHRLGAVESVALPEGNAT
jgi:hypothetical protein